MDFQLSEKAKQLIPKARIVSLAGWEKTFPMETIARFQAADDEGRYLTDADFTQLAAAPNPPPLLSEARVLRDLASEIVSEARTKVLAQFPNITEPGGDLYPPIRAEACWRDFWHFLRCITYGMAGGRTEYT